MASLSALVILSSLVCCADSASFVISMSSLGLDLSEGCWIPVYWWD